MRRILRALLGLSVTVATIGIVQPLLTGSASAATISVSTQDAPDPGFSKFGSDYYVYATSGSNGVLPILRGTSLTANNSWTKVGNAYASAPSGYSALWAPHVVLREGKYLLFFTASHNGASHCIYWAVSSSPTGGFDAPHQLICDGGGFESIDPTIYHSAAGDDYVVWKKGMYNSRGFPYGDFYINARKLSVSATSVSLAAGSSTFTLASVVNATCMEAPTVFSHGDRVWLFVSRGRFDTDDYRTEAWSSVDFFHPFTVSNTVMQTGQGYGAGPGGAETINENGTIRVAYHVWDRDKPTPSSPGERKSRVGTVLWHSDGQPYVG